MKRVGRGARMTLLPTPAESSGAQDKFAGWPICTALPPVRARYPDVHKFVWNEFEQPKAGSEGESHGWLS